MCAKDVYRHCPECKKTRPESCGRFVYDHPERWYCSERCLQKGERVHKYSKR